MFEPRGSDQFAAASDWMASLLTGGLAVGVCVMAVALVGFAMLTGRLALRRGAMVVLGCFVLLGAPAIAAALTEIGESDDAQVAFFEVPQVEELPPRGDIPASTYNPYAGASLRRGSANSNID